LKYADQEVDKRRAAAAYYQKHITNSKLKLPNWDADIKNHVFHLYVIRCEQRDELQDYLAQYDIQTVIHYPIPPHRQEAYSEWNHLSFPLTEEIHNEVLSLPMSPVISKKEQDHVIKALNAF
jgi:dTDP-4-amino-4,6-dideoxygalactose transaminase